MQRLWAIKIAHNICQNKLPFHMSFLPSSRSPQLLTCEISSHSQHTRGRSLWLSNPNLTSCSVSHPNLPSFHNAFQNSILYVPTNETNWQYVLNEIYWADYITISITTISAKHFPARRYTSCARYWQLCARIMLTKQWLISFHNSNLPYVHFSLNTDCIGIISFLFHCIVSFYMLFSINNYKYKEPRPTWSRAVLHYNSCVFIWYQSCLRLTSVFFVLMASSTVDSSPIPLANLNHHITLKLTHKIFLLWCYLMASYLEAQDLFGYVNGSIPCPP